MWGWSRLAYGSVLVGIVRRAGGRALSRRCSAKRESRSASFTFSAAAVHAAIRLNGGGHGAGLRGARTHRDGRRRGLRRKPGAAGVLRRVQSDAAARRGAGAGRTAAAARYTAPRRSNRFYPSPPSIRWKTISPATHYRTRRRWPGPVPCWRRPRTCCRAEHRRSSSRAMLIPTPGARRAAAVCWPAGCSAIALRRPQVPGRHERGDRPRRAGRGARRGARAADRQGARADATAGPFPRADAARPGRAERADPADRAAGLDQRDRPEPRNGAHHGRGAARRAAGKNPGFLAVLRELGAGFHQPGEQGGTGETFQIHTSRENGK